LAGAHLLVPALALLSQQHELFTPIAADKDGQRVPTVNRPKAKFAPNGVSHLALRRQGVAGAIEVSVNGRGSSHAKAEACAHAQFAERTRREVVKVTRRVESTPVAAETLPPESSGIWNKNAKLSIPSQHAMAFSQQPLRIVDVLEYMVQYNGVKGVVRETYIMWPAAVDLQTPFASVRYRSLVHVNALDTPTQASHQSEELSISTSHIKQHSARTGLKITDRSGKISCSEWLQVQTVSQESPPW